jgi:hypothetical protein
MIIGEPLWLSGKVVKNEKINEIERTRVCYPPRATSLKNILNNYKFYKFCSPNHRANALVVFGPARPPGAICRNLSQAHMERLENFA